MKIALSTEALIEQVNKEMAEQEWFEPGMEVVEARMEGNILVMHSAGMLDEKQNVDLKKAVNLNKFAKEIGDRYTIQEK